jgi:hypothetical protein
MVANGGKMVTGSHNRNEFVTISHAADAPGPVVSLSLPLFLLTGPSEICCPCLHGWSILQLIDNAEAPNSESIKEYQINWN